MNTEQKQSDHSNQLNQFQKQNNNSRNSSRPRRDNRNSQGRQEQEKSEFEHQVIITKRVTKVVTSGKRMRFTAAVVVGNRRGKVGFALSKGVDLRSAIEKAVKKATQNVFKVKIADGSIPFQIDHKFKSASIFLKPAKSGTGLIVSNSIRPIFELSGITDIYSKIHGTNNKLTNSYCVISALKLFSDSK